MLRDVSCKDGHKGKKRYGPSRSRRYQEEAARIHRRNTQKSFDLTSQDDVITHRELGKLGCEVKWALGSITMNKASGGDGIPAELSQILKDNAAEVKCLICQQIWKNQQWPQDWKNSVFISMPKNINAKESSNYHVIALISHASKVMLKILQDRLQQYVNCALQMYKPVLEKAVESEIKLPTSTGSQKKQDNSRENLPLLH